MINRTIKFIITFLTLTTSLVTKGYTQADTATKQNAYAGMSLEDLLDVKIVSVSKSAELLFDSPLSASVVTKEEIRRAGCTSIMEALRLVPGMIVREQSNGNYDIYLRGMDNVPPNAPFEGNSTTTLVMIDSRPIYNYLKGGTFWETLPVDLNDVEKIEVVRGPAAALYGPNAVSGVINIITRQTRTDGLYIVANNQQGSFNTFINNASVGYQAKNWSVIASGNYQGRDRSQTSYYEFYRNQWLEQPAFFIGILNDTNPNLIPNPRLAIKKYAGNIFLSYEPADEVKFTIAAGIQHSMVQKVSNENGNTPLSTVLSDSRYVDLRAGVKGFSAQLAYLRGTQTPMYPGNKYDFNTADASVEYNYTKGNLMLKPGLSYRSAVYDDTKYSDLAIKSGIFNARGRIITQTASLHAEYKMLKQKLRLVGGIAMNKFNYPDAAYFSYEMAATYKINKKHLFRAAYSRAPRSATIYDTYVDQHLQSYQIGYQKYMLMSIEGNKNLQLLTANMLETGYRGMLSEKLYIDVEFFDIHSRNYTSITVHANYSKINGNDTTLITPLIATNLPVRLHQQGVTVSAAWQTGNLQIKPFITIQHSTIKNYSPYLNMPDASGPLAIDAQQNNIYSGMGIQSDLKSTPAVFGGASLNYTPGNKWNINVNAYYYSAQTYYHLTNSVFNDGIRGIDHLKAKLILNAKIAYEPTKGMQLFCNVKNILNNKSREFFRSDNAPFMLYGGINYEF
jgi:iron complex outermembrane receptor protein